MLMFVGVVNVVVAVVIVDLSVVENDDDDEDDVVDDDNGVGGGGDIDCNRDVEGDDDDVESVDMRVTLFNFVLYYFKATLKH